MGPIHIAWVSQLNRLRSLAAKSVQSPALPLQGIDNVHSSDSLPLSMLSVGDSISDDIFEENLKDTSGFFIDESRNSLDSTTTSQSPDSGLSDALDVVSQHLTMTLGATLSKSLASFASSSHVDEFSETDAALV